MAKLYLDDVRPVPLGWVLVKNYDEFVNYITINGLPEFISFDHDLAEEQYPWNDPNYGKGFLSYDTYKEKTGYDCVKWLVEYCQTNNLSLPPYQTHTMNPIGKKNMEIYLENAKKHLNL